MLVGAQGGRMMIGRFLEEVGHELASQTEQGSGEQRGGKAFWVKEMALAETRWRHGMIGVGHPLGWMEGLDGE